MPQRRNCVGAPGAGRLILTFPSRRWRPKVSCGMTLLSTLRAVLRTRTALGRSCLTGVKNFCVRPILRLFRAARTGFLRSPPDAAQESGRSVRPASGPCLNYCLALGRAKLSLTIPRSGIARHGPWLTCAGWFLNCLISPGPMGLLWRLWRPWSMPIRSKKDKLPNKHGDALLATPCLLPVRMSNGRPTRSRSGTTLLLRIGP